MATSGQLGQVAASATPDTVVTVYTVPDANTRISNLILTICNVSGADSTYRVFQDDDGTAETAAVALYYDVAILADTTIRLSIGAMDTNAGTIKASSGHNASLTFTLHGTKTLI